MMFKTKRLFEAALADEKTAHEQTRRRAEERLDRLRAEFEEKLEAERKRFDSELRQHRVREQMLIDRLMVRSGNPAMYGTIEEPSEALYRQTNDPYGGLPPGEASVMYYQDYEDRLWKENLEQIRAEARALAQNSTPSD